MACVKPDGSLTETAKVLLRQLENPLKVEEIAPRINQPLFKVRSVMRELVGNGLAMETDGKFQITSKGKEKMNIERPTSNSVKITSRLWGEGDNRRQGSFRIKPPSSTSLGRWLPDRASGNPG